MDVAYRCGNGGGKELKGLQMLVTVTIALLLSLNHSYFDKQWVGFEFEIFVFCELVD